MHKRVLALAAAGFSGPQIIADFVKQNGPAVLMVLPQHGLNLAAYYLPGMLGLTAAILLFLALRRWARAAEPRPPAAPPAASAGELERLPRAPAPFAAGAPGSSWWRGPVLRAGGGGSSPGPVFGP